MKSPETYDRRRALRIDGEMAERVAAFDWSATPMGPLDGWSPVLRAHVRMMLASRFPMMIFWTRELVTLYNDALRPSMSENGKHPRILGQPGAVAWRESWPSSGPMIEAIMAGGSAVFVENQKTPFERDGIIDVSYWTYSFSPLTDDEGLVNGVLVTCLETTQGIEHLEYFAGTEPPAEIPVPLPV